ncbi:MAG: hypothetical protein AAF212_05635 [Verrucomicrobiota bacterium]
MMSDKNIRRIWSPEKWEENQDRLRRNYERAQEQLERTRLLTERYYEQIERVKSAPFVGASDFQ